MHLGHPHFVSGLSEPDLHAVDMGGGAKAGSLKARGDASRLLGPRETRSCAFRIFKR